MRLGGVLMGSNIQENNHEHNHAHSNHKHSDEDYKKLINRMSRIIGHANSVKTMMEEHRDCTEILIQISAVKAALNNLGKKILEDHINKCIVDVVGEEQLEENKVKLQDFAMAFTVQAAECGTEIREARKQYID